MVSISTTLFTLIASAAVWGACGGSNASTNRNYEYVRDACRVTKYPNLCVRSLSTYSDEAKRSPQRWARAAVSVTLAEAESAGQYLARFKGGEGMRGRAKMALLDCMECFQDTIDQLHSSLFELRRLQRKTFERQIGDIETWVSAALTYEDTCLDGWNRYGGAQARALRSKVGNVSMFTSNALALVNRLASEGSGAAVLDDGLS
ncbi:hypothetical protein ACLOJK_026226 [Asimina triloba]